MANFISQLQSEPPSWADLSISPSKSTLTSGRPSTLLLPERPPRQLSPSNSLKALLRQNGHLSYSRMSIMPILSSISMLELAVETSFLTRYVVDSLPSRRRTMPFGMCDAVHYHDMHNNTNNQHRSGVAITASYVMQQSARLLKVRIG